MVDLNIAGKKERGVSEERRHRRAADGVKIAWRSGMHRRRINQAATEVNKDVREAVFKTLDEVVKKDNPKEIFDALNKGITGLSGDKLDAAKDFSMRLKKRPILLPAVRVKCYGLEKEHHKYLRQFQKYHSLEVVWHLA